MSFFQEKPVKGTSSLVLTLALTLALLPGCSSTRLETGGSAPYIHIRSTLEHHTREATEKLLAEIRGKSQISGPFLIASLANIDNIQRSSTFGRLVSEQIGNHFTQKGYKILDVRIGEKIFIKKGEGEFLMSRQVRNASRTYDASAVLIGTYAVSSETVHASVRLVRAKDNQILAATNIQIPKTDRIRSLL